MEWNEVDPKDMKKWEKGDRGNSSKNQGNESESEWAWRGVEWGGSLRASEHQTEVAPPLMYIIKTDGDQSW